VNQKHEASAIPILSFFTGGGFLDLGFEEAGFETVWCNEFNPDFADMFEYGMWALRKSTNPRAPVVTVNSRASIVDLRPGQVLFDAFDGPAPLRFGVIGGPPCPDFSNGGKHRGHEGDHGKLSKSYINMVCDLKPAFFLMENVPGLIKTKKHRAFFDRLRAQLRAAGFLTDFALLNALDFGVPQDRNRVFMVGVSHKEWSRLFGQKPLPQEDGWFSFPKPLFENPKSLRWPTISKFGGQPVKPPEIPEVLMTNYWLEGKVDVSKLPNGDEFFTPYSNKFLTVAEGDDSKKSFKRLHRYRYSPTVCYGNNEVHLHPWKPRRLSVREALRIQTIPDAYILPKEKSLSAKFKMIANGVPAILAKEIAKSLMRFLRKNDRAR
jgi:DNA (cytosine-5)-methyltransferase 1